MQLLANLKLLIASLFVLFFAGLAIAQSLFSTAYRVNSGVITYYDIDQFSKMLEATGTPADGIEQAAIDFLIDDLLLQQETARFGLENDPVLVSRTLDRMAGGEEGAGQELRAQLNAAGIDDTTIERYISFQILLRSYLELRGIRAEPSDEEIAQIILDIPDQVTETVRIAEIILPYQSFGGPTSTAFAANQIRARFEAGESFDDLAVEFSASPTAASGGRLPPIPLQGLTPELEALVTTTAPGDIAPNIDLGGAIALIRFIGFSEQRTSLPRAPSLSYIALDFSTTAEAQNFAKRIPTCAAAATYAKDENPDALNENVSPSTLPQDIALGLARIETENYTIIDKRAGVELLYLCDYRIGVPEELTAPVYNRAFDTATRQAAKGVLSELRAIANIVKVN